jgi:hypothetical protein
VYDPSLGDAQIHDFNPGVSPTGVFWTTVVSGDSVVVDLDAGTATLEVHDLRQKDYFDFENAILGNGATPKMGLVSFKVQWSEPVSRDSFDNPSQQFRGDFSFGIARMDWTGRSGQFEFRSGPLEESVSDVAQVGFESNGSFY